MAKSTSNEKMGTQNIANISEAIRLHQQNAQMKKQDSLASNEEKGTPKLQTETTQPEIKNVATQEERTFRVCANMPQELHRRIRNYQYAQPTKVTIEDFLIAATSDFLQKNNF